MLSFKIQFCLVKKKTMFYFEDITGGWYTFKINQAEYFEKT